MNTKYIGWDSYVHAASSTRLVDMLAIPKIRGTEGGFSQTNRFVIISIDTNGRGRSDFVTT